MTHQLRIHLDGLLRQALREDIGPGDLTTDALAPLHLRGRAEIVCKGMATIAGLWVALRCYFLLDPSVRASVRVKEGAPASPGTVLAELEGPVSSILSGERVALNFLGHLSGIATLTHQFVDRLQGCRTRLLDTRKTTPGLRWLEKNAVRTGGGGNHRLGLFDGILVKDNHIVACGGIAEAVRRLRESRLAPGLRIEVEVRTLAELDEAITAGADILLLDNMDTATLRQAVTRAGGRVLLEASGNIGLDNAREVAATGVDFISVGALTHSAPAIDLSLRLLSPTPR